MTQETFLEMAIRHRADDMLVARRFEVIDGKACSIGCFCHDYGLEPSDFSGLAEITKYPEEAHHLQEAIFEGLPKSERANWHVAFAEKAATVTDWQMVIDKTVLASLRIAEPHDTSESKVVATVIDLYERRLTGDNPSDAEWASAESASWASAGSAAGSSAGSAAGSAAWAAGAAEAADAAEAAVWAARIAKRASEGAAAAGAAESAAWVQIRDTFLNA
jgi:hypothetical protein